MLVILKMTKVKTGSVKKARVENLEPMEIVQKYTVDFHGTLRKFNLLPPSIEPSATGHIIEQINLIKKLVEKKSCLRKERLSIF